MPQFYSIPCIHLALLWEHSSLLQRFHLRNTERYYSNYLWFISLNYKNVEEAVCVDISYLPKVGQAKEWGLKKDTVVLSELQTFLWAEISLQFSVSGWEQS